MPELFFNSEIGFATDLSLVQKAIDDAARCLNALENEFQAIDTDEMRGDVPKNFVLYVSDDGAQNTLVTLFNALGKRENGCLKVLLNMFKCGKRVRIPDEICMLTCEELEAPSGIVEFVARQNAFLLSFATHGCWKNTFFHFLEDKELVCPNVWGQSGVELEALKEWIRSWHRKEDAPFERLKRDFNAVVCDMGFHEVDLTSEEWVGLFHTMEVARTRNYAPDGETVKIFNGVPVSEFRSGVIRIFFQRRHGQLFIGGYYKKGTCPGTVTNNGQKKIAKRACTRIIAYLNNHCIFE